MKSNLKSLACLFITAPLALSSLGAAESAAKSNFITQDTPESAEVRKLGENAINRMAVSLVREVNTALANGGAERAVDVVHLKDIQMINGTVAGIPRITAMKRTSLKLRSPANAPDAADQLALEEMLRQMQTGEAAPSVLVQRAEIPPAAPEWRVYKAVGTLPKCLACHGDPAEQSETLRSVLRRYYPDDQATGYAAGTWRGVLRVTVADAPPAAPKPAPAKKS
jgi:Protein of unknown function (DUF3365)